MKLEFLDQIQLIHPRKAWQEIIVDLAPVMEKLYL